MYYTLHIPLNTQTLFANWLINFLPPCSPTVSYTHLDVYKRQHSGLHQFIIKKTLSTYEMILLNYVPNTHVTMPRGVVPFILQTLIRNKHCKYNKHNEI